MLASRLPKVCTAALSEPVEPEVKLRTAGASSSVSTATGSVPPSASRPS